jgi:glutamate-1-semialdehyde 2,1-aminomutase
MPKASSPPLSPTAGLAVNIKSQPQSSDLDSAVAAAKQRFVGRNPISRKLFEEATGYLPGGNTRSLLYTAPYPICMKKGENYKVFDEDGHE